MPNPQPLACSHRGTSRGGGLAIKVRGGRSFASGLGKSALAVACSVTRATIAQERMAKREEYITGTRGEGGREGPAHDSRLR